MTGTSKDAAKKPGSPARARQGSPARASKAKASFAEAPVTTAMGTTETVTVDTMPAATIVDDAAPAWTSPVVIHQAATETTPTETTLIESPTSDATTSDATTSDATTSDATTGDIPAPPRAPPALKLITPTSSYAPKLKEIIMATAFGTTNETVTETVKATVSQFNESAEAAMAGGKEAMEKITAQAKDAAENSMKSIEEMTDLARGNVEAMLASARVAAAGFETLAAHISEVSRKSFEGTTTAARAMTSAKTPNELFQLQSDFAKTQFDVAVSEFSKMTEMMVKLSGEVMEPVQNRLAVATDKMKTVFTK